MACYCVLFIMKVNSLNNVCSIRVILAYYTHRSVYVQYTWSVHALLYYNIDQAVPAAATAQSTAPQATPFSPTSSVTSTTSTSRTGKLGVWVAIMMIEFGA